KMIMDVKVDTKRLEKVDVWIYKDRIVYVGELLPEKTNGCDVIDCTGQYLVPGYIEPHAHPFQLYNPESLAYFAAKYGTTTLINDNLRLLTLLETEKSFSLIDDLHQLPSSTFWWGRYDLQTIMREYYKVFNTETYSAWMENPSVIQGGELTSWPQLLEGDDRLLYWLQETKRMKK